MSGWIKLHRSIQDSFYWNDEAFSKGQAWIDLLILANHKAGIVRTRSGVVDVPRGSLAWSKEKLAVRWKWSRGKVLRFLAELCKQLMIVQRTVQRITVVSICNYEEYQGEVDSDGTTDSTVSSTTNGTMDGTTNGTMDGTVTRSLRKKEVKNKDIKQKFEPPDFIPLASWEKYLISRKEKKHPMNPASLELAVKAITKTHDAGYAVDEILEAMIEAGWRSVKADWLKNLEQSSGNNNRQNQSEAIDVDSDFELDPWAGIDQNDIFGVGCEGEGGGSGQNDCNEGPDAIEGDFTRMEAGAV